MFVSSSAGLLYLSSRVETVNGILRALTQNSVRLLFSSLVFIHVVEFQQAEDDLMPFITLNQNMR